jgi:hypothetical protein
MLHPVHDAGVDGVDIAEAARCLGISSQAVHKRIRRGSLNARKDGGRWYVVLPGVMDRSTSSGKDADSPAGKTLGRTDGVDASRTLVDSLQDEVKWLRSQLAERSEEIRRRDMIIGALAQRPTALPTTITHEEAPPPVRERRHWWSWLVWGS